MATSSFSVETESFQLISSLRYDPELATAAAETTENAYPFPRDSPYYLLSYHYDRLLSAAKSFEWERAIETLQRLSSDSKHDQLASFSQALDPFIKDKTRAWRLRILLSINGTIAVEAAPTSPFTSHTLLLPPPSQTPPPSFTTLSQPETNNKLWHLYLDTQPITPSGFTTHKTTARDMYADARYRARLNTSQHLAEVLVYNPQGEVMEGSVTTPYFRRREANNGSGDNHSQVGTVDWITPPLSSGGNAGTTRRYALSREFCVEEIIKTTDIVDGEECWLSNGVRGFMKAVVVLDRASEP